MNTAPDCPTGQRLECPQPIDASLVTRATGLSYRPLTDTLDAYDAWARNKRILPPLPMEVAS